MNARNAKKVSIVIPTCNNVPYLSLCLQALLPSLKAFNSEVIIVSNGNDQEMAVTLGYVNGVRRATGSHIVPLHTKQKGFSAACNAGMRMAKGEYIVLLNDDTVVAQNWLDELVGALLTAKSAAPDVQWGYAGCMSNSAKGRQILNVKRFVYAGQPGGVEDTAARLIQADDLPPFLPAADISGFCLLIQRDLYKAIGGLVDFGGGGFEDNDYCLRAQQAGYWGIIAPKSFVFHFGKISMTREMGNDYKGGTFLMPQFVKHWYKPRPQKLCVAYTVKIDTAEDMCLFIQTVRRMGELTDTMVIFDDRSELNIQEELKCEGLDKLITIYERNTEGERNEPRNRNHLLEMARKTEPDWIWMLDHDEIPDERCTPELLHRLFNSTNPQVKGYVMPMAHFWRSTERIRADGIFGNLLHRGPFKNDKGAGGIHQPGESLFHCPHWPAFMPQDVCTVTFTTTVKHYGYDSWEKTKRKQNYYQTHDKVKDARLIGTPNYEHLTDESTLKLLPFSTQPTVTLLYLASNEEYEVASRIRQYKEMFDKMLIVETAGDKAVIDLCTSLDVEVRSYRCCDKATEPEHMICDFSKARNWAIEQCKTDYILFMDPDEEFNAKTITLLDKIILEGADAYMMEIHNIHQEGKKIYKTHQPRLFRNIPQIRYQESTHETIEQSLRDNPELLVARCPLVVLHYGFLKTDAAARKKRNDAYAVKLREVIEADPKNYRALFALGIHENEYGRYEEGDNYLGRAIQANPRFWTARWELALRLSRRGLDLLLSTPPDIRPDGDLGAHAQQFIKDNIKWHPELTEQKLLAS
jgi:GT2 family glycosyltransferase/tetratricopeptide (TPR) repeat protein